MSKYLLETDTLIANQVSGERKSLNERAPQFLEITQPAYTVPGQIRLSEAEARLALKAISDFLYNLRPGRHMEMPG